MSRKTCCSVVFIFFLMLSISVHAEKELADPLLMQAGFAPANSDGRIVESSLKNIRSPYKAKVECYEITYMSDNLEIEGYIVLPLERPEKLPVIIYNRGGGPLSTIGGSQLKYLYYIASKGYAVFASDYRGKQHDRFGGEDVNDVLNMVTLAKSLPFVKENKIGMLGYSRGGMMTLRAISTGLEITAACTVGAITDLTKTYNQSGWLKKKLTKYVIKGDPASAKEEYALRSAVKWPEKLDVPLLLLHGSKDRKISVSQSRVLYERLDSLDKKSKLIVFPEGNHDLSSHIRERDEVILEWFDKYLK